jgi:hypothetical protein
MKGSTPEAAPMVANQALGEGEGLVGRSAGDRLQFKPVPARFGERRENVDARDLALDGAERLRRERRSGPDERV